MKNKAKLAVACGLLLITLVLNACTFFPLPKEKRYERINNIISQIDYKQVEGQIFAERYDRGDGVFSPSFWYVEIEGGTEAFNFLKKEILNVKDNDCGNINNSTYLYCDVGVVSVELRKLQRTENLSTVSIVITDVLGGRENK